MSAPQTRSITLDGRTFVISFLPASQALTAAAIYANSFAPMIDGVRRARAAGNKGTEQKLAGLAEIIGQPGLASQLKGLAYIFAECTQVAEGDGRSFQLAQRDGADGKGPLNTAVFDRVFAGRVSSLWAWLQAAIDHNLSDFLAVLREKLAEAAPDVFASKSPPTSPTTG